MLLFCLFGFMVCIIFFFFFKQKTAYEMRISDWSSDVCSSDLIVSGRGGHFETAGHAINPDHRFASLAACHHIGASPEADTIGPLAGFHGHKMRAPQRPARASAIRCVGASREIARHCIFVTGPAESDVKPVVGERIWTSRSEEHTSELQSLM